jgi:hypothetical protein
MLRRSTAVLTLGALTAMLLIPTSASAAVEAGDDCAGGLYGGNFSLVPESRAGGTGLPLSAPVAGVVTRWRVNSTFPEPSPVRMAVFRLVAPGRFLVVGESREEVAAPGQSTFTARIPVEAGDRFGEVSAGGNYLACITGSPEDHTWSLNGIVAGFGSTYQFAAGTEVRIPIAAVIEPDADGDGYGDETQDSCPQSAAHQVPCPPLTLSLYAVPGKKSVTVLVSAGVSAQVTVTGQAQLPPKKGKAGSSAQVKLAPVKHLANPGQITKYKLTFPSKLRSALASVPKGKSVKLKLTARGANVAGVAKAVGATVKLKGQG